MTDLAEHRSPTRATPLHYAALQGLSWATTLIFALGRDIDVEDDSDGTPMRAALAMGHLEVACFLFKHGADVNVKL